MKENRRGIDVRDFAEFGVVLVSCWKGKGVSFVCSQPVARSSVLMDKIVAKCSIDLIVEGLAFISFVQTGREVILVILVVSHTKNRNGRCFTLSSWSVSKSTARLLPKRGST